MEGAGAKPPIIIGRYALFDAIASGGMATVHLGRLLGEVGFSRTVAIKRLHSQHAMDPDFVTMFIDEARLAARVRHPNVVQTLDVGATDGELFVVMDYIEGESLSRMLRLAMETGERIDERIVSRIMTDALQGLHAAHDAKSEDGTPLDIVHRDVSPQNILVGVDGISRVLDFGIAKATGRGQTTRDGQIKGKLSYMAPEQLLGSDVSRRTDVFAAGIVLWELLTSRRLFAGGSEGEIVRRVLDMPIPVVTHIVKELPRSIEAVVARALARNADDRFRSAAEFADALDAAIPPATARTVGEWIKSRADSTLSRRAALVADVERSSPVSSARSSSAALTEPMPDSLTIPVDLATAHATARPITTEAKASLGKWIALGAAVSVVGLVAGAAVLAKKDHAHDPAPATSAPAAPNPLAAAQSSSAAPLATPAPSSPSSAEVAATPSSTPATSATSAKHATATKAAPPPVVPVKKTTPQGDGKAVAPAPSQGGGLYTRD